MKLPSLSSCYEDKSKEISTIFFMRILLAALCVLACNLFALRTSAQTPLAAISDEPAVRPDTQRALASRTRSASNARLDGHQPQTKAADLRSHTATDVLQAKSSAQRSERSGGATRPRISARNIIGRTAEKDNALQKAANSLPPPIRFNTSLSRVLHTSQLSLASSNGSIEQYADANGDNRADERTKFDAAGGAFDVATGRSGARYEVFSATDRATNRSTGVLVTAFDTNGDFVRDSSATFDLRATYSLRSAASVVAGNARNGREFVIVSSSGYYNSSNANDPNNEPSAGVVLLVRDSQTNGFDTRGSRELVRAGSNELNNANSIALLPSGDLLIADFDSNELRIVRDRDSDGIPDTLDPTPFYSYQFSNDRPLEVAANSRGVVFSHSVGNRAVLLAIYDDDADGRADGEEIAVEDLSIDNNLFLHGLTVDREGSVYVIEDATGDTDTQAEGGNLGTARILVFPDPALNGILRDGSVFASADASTLALTGLSFGIDSRLAPVGSLTIINSASLQGAATFGGLGTITGANLTNNLSGASESAARSAGVRVTMEGVEVPVLSFNSERINVYVLPSASNATEGVRAVVVSIKGTTYAASDVRFAATNPGIFTQNHTGTGEAVALLVSGMRYTASPFPATVNNETSVVALFGTGWRNAASLTVRIGEQNAKVEFTGTTTFAGLDQINVRLPAGARGALPIVVTTADGATSRSNTFITVQ